MEKVEKKYPNYEKLIKKSKKKLFKRIALMAGSLLVLLLIIFEVYVFASFFESPSNRNQDNSTGNNETQNTLLDIGDNFSTSVYSAPPVGYNNLFTNPGIEDGKAGWDYLTFGRESHSGNWSLIASSPYSRSATNQISGFSLADKQMILIFWAKSISGTNNLEVKVNGATIFTQSVSDSWQEYEIDYTFPGDAPDTFKFNFDSANQSVRCDDFFLYFPGYTELTIPAIPPKVEDYDSHWLYPDAYTDPNYLDSLYFRITTANDNAADVYFSMHVRPGGRLHNLKENHGIVTYYNDWIDAGTAINNQTGRNGIFSDLHIKPGESTEWIELTYPLVFLNMQPNSTVAYNYNKIVLTAYDGASTEYWGEIFKTLNATIEITDDPVTPTFTKTLTRTGDGSSFMFRFPRYIPDNSDGSEIISVEEDIDQMYQNFQNLPDVGTKTPEKTIMVSSIGLEKLQDTLSVDAYNKQKEIFSEELGFNGIFSTVTGIDTVRKEVFDDWGLTKNLINLGYNSNVNNSSLVPDTSSIETTYSNAKNTLSSMGIYSHIGGIYIFEEPGVSTISVLRAISGYNDLFKTYLQDEGITLDELGVLGWDDVEMKTPEESVAFPALFYHSALFRSSRLANAEKQVYPISDQYFPGIGRYTGFSHTFHYGGNMVEKRGITEYDYIRESGSNGISISSWLPDAATLQQESYGAEIMRSATKYTSADIMGIMILFKTPEEIRKIFYSALSQGVRRFLFFAYGPHYVSGNEFYSDNEDTNAVIRELSHEIGEFDDYLAESERESSDVAILYSETSDAWMWSHKVINRADTGQNPYAGEKLGIYLALRHNQIQSDLITEYDIENDYLDNYKVLYLPGMNLPTSVAEKIKTWVYNGGILFADSGAGSKDQYNVNTDILDPVFGISQGDNIQKENTHSLDHYAYHLFSGWYTPPENIEYNGDTSYMFAFYPEDFTINSPNVEVLGTNTDRSSPAIISNEYGSGKVLFANYMPGVSYIAKALLPQGWPITGAPVWPAIERDLIYLPIEWAGIDPKIRLNYPVIQTSILEGTGYTLIPIVNFLDVQVNDLEMEYVTDTSRNYSVTSIELGNLPYSDINDGIKINFALSDTDMILIKDIGAKANIVPGTDTAGVTGSDDQKAAVVKGTAVDLLEDISWPSINIWGKLSNIVSLLIAALISFSFRVIVCTSVVLAMIMILFLIYLVKRKNRYDSGNAIIFNIVLLYLKMKLKLLGKRKKPSDY